MRMAVLRLTSGLGVALILAFWAIHAPATGEPARRIVSLNLCIDPILMALVPRERIAALSIVSSDPDVSLLTGKLDGIKLVRGSAEDVLALDPDLVLAGAFTTPATVSLLRRLGRRVEVIEQASNSEGIIRVIRQIAAALSEEEQGRLLIESFSRRLDAVTPTSPERPSAVAYHANGLVSGGDTLLDEAMTRAGFINAAQDLAPGRGGRIALEALIATPPDLLILAQARDTYRSVAADNLRHPALAVLMTRRPSLVLPMPYWICGTPALAHAAELLADTRRRMLADPGPR